MVAKREAKDARDMPTAAARRIDLDDPSTWPAALDGVSAVYVVDPTTDRQERIPRVRDRRWRAATGAAVAPRPDRPARRGSRAISFGEATDLIRKASGRAIRYVDVAPETFTETQVAHGVPRDLARLLANLLMTVRDGDATTISEGVTRPPRPFEVYATEAAAEGHWSPDA